jgi:hypothetical protein
VVIIALSEVRAERRQLLPVLIVVFEAGESAGLSVTASQEYNAIAIILTRGLDSLWIAGCPCVTL